MTIPQKPVAQPAKKGVSVGVLALLGCGGVVVLGMVLCGGLIGWGVWVGVQAADDFAKKFEDRGFERVAAQQHTVSNKVSSPTVFFTQQLEIKDGSEVEIAMATQAAELHGDFDGDVHFLGQMLHIKSDAVLHGDLKVEAGQVIVVEGDVKGQITGTYQVLDDRRRKQAAAPEVAESASDAAEVHGEASAAEVHGEANASEVHGETSAAETTSEAAASDESGSEASASDESTPPADSGEASSTDGN